MEEERGLALWDKSWERYWKESGGKMFVSVTDDGWMDG